MHKIYTVCIKRYRNTKTRKNKLAFSKNVIPILSIKEYGAQFDVA
jgi:hypothetical protein